MERFFGGAAGLSRHSFPVAEDSLQFGKRRHAFSVVSPDRHMGITRRVRVFTLVQNSSISRASWLLAIQDRVQVGERVQTVWLIVQ